MKHLNAIQCCVDDSGHTTLAGQLKWLEKFVSIDKATRTSLPAKGVKVCQHQLLLSSQLSLLHKARLPSPSNSEHASMWFVLLKVP